MARIRYSTTLDEDLLNMVKHRASLIDRLHGANDIIEQALKFYFRNASVTVWEKSINTEDDNKDKHFQKLILRSNRLVLETVQDRTTIKKYDPEAVSSKKLKDCKSLLDYRCTAIYYNISSLYVDILIV
ncbi:hypothetical protein [Vallitalea sp.]|jgi:hypothetical protein|uniref:hypothetical protein n=1 Tax=Vallitalea sp. TaxID=1882829 RepID=UPI0025E4F78F|nr:hypothetical protein [Vallitalea sp.]MCT4686780.1 hypothetical protein [Vallitalea sp.]